ncbi:DNA polymerase III subunit beta [Sphingomonas yunnanensis]|uniref:DNA polymerase III subunit beta n=1 Tax=Sphingomonas yunnanensis TaxID=310400 RepID=UPI001CA6FCC5|nr:DNA polymerase III subunit beta [Sphingomonas yunnanensis]MBY9062320.1 DNA polymerase III subunit beta [Sphingomonas yunnanensis]
MTIEIERDALLAALRQVADVVEARNTIPVLGNLLLVAGSGSLTVTGTDLDIEASATVPAAGEIETTIDARKLVAAVASLKPGRLTIGAAADRSAAVAIKSGRSTRTLGTLPGQDFPKRKPPEAACAFSMQSAVLARMLGACHVAQSTDETRYYLNGVYLHLVDGHLVATATDAIKLVSAKTAAPEGCDRMAQVIVPSKAVGLLRKLLAKAPGTIDLLVSENAVQASTGNVRLTFKTVDGTFPDYRRVIPMDTPGAHRIMLWRDALIEAVNGVTSITDAEGERKSRRVLLQLTDGAETHMLSARDTTGSSGNDEIEATVEGGDTVLELDQRFLLSAAGVFAEGAELTLHFIGESPVPVRLTSDKDPDLVAVIQSIGVPGGKS